MKTFRFIHKNSLHLRRPFTLDVPVRKLVTLLALSATAAFAADIAYTPPVGGMTITIAAGTGTNRAVTNISAPLWMEASIDGATSGQISSVSANSITCSAAGWTAGQISSAATPHFIQITSGAAAGRAFLISTSNGSANTATTVTVDATENVDLTSLGITSGVSGDTFKIFAADTLSLLLPSSAGVLTGTSATAADNVLLNIGGVWRTYYFNSTLGRWTQVAFGSPNASNVPVGPASGIQYSRLGASPITLTVLGTGPSLSRKVSVANTGVSFVSAGWPVDTTLAATGIQNISGWVKSNNVNSADTVQLLVGGIWRRYYHDGTNWRQAAFGSPNSNAQSIPAGSAYVINRAAGAGNATLTESKPY